MAATVTDERCGSYLMLRPRIRPESSLDRTNLFVRLSPTTARHLHMMAAHDTTEGESNVMAPTTHWMERIAVEPTVPVEFLALKLTWNDQVRIYASYNGGDFDSHPDDADQCIDIPLSLVPEPHRCSLERVKVQPIRNIVTAVSLTVEPCTVDDWELMQLDAAWLEQGGLLQQVSLVYVGQILSVQLSHGTTVQVKVLANKHTVWPMSKRSCWRLTARAEIVVVPKPRTRTLPSWQLVPTREDCTSDPSMVSLAAALAVELISVPQGTALIHDDAYGRLCGRPCDHETHRYATMTQGNQHVTVRIGTSQLVPENGIALHPLARLKLGAPLLTFEPAVSVQMLSAFEFERIISILPDRLAATPIRVALVPLTIPEPNRTVPWRHSDMTESQPTQHALPLLGNEIERLTASPDFLVEIGGFLVLETEGNDGIVQLVLESNTGQELDAECTQGLLFAHSLPSLLQLNQLDTSIRPLLVLDLPQRSTVQRLLPTEAFVSSSMLRLLQDAAMRSDVVLYGERGCGKTFTAMAIAATLRLVKRYQTVYLDCRKLKQSGQIRMNEILAQISSVFIDAVDSSPCVVILDDLDELTPSFDDAGSSDDSIQLQQINPIEIDQSKLVADVIFSRMRSLGHAVTFVVTCRSENSLPSSMLGARNFDLRVPVPAVEEAEREPLFYTLVRRKVSQVTTPDRRDVEFARKTVGFRPRDLEQIALRLCRNQCLHNGSSTSTCLDAASELDTFVPLSRLGTTSETNSSISLSDIGGLFQAKNELRSIVLQPFRYRRIYERAKIRLPRGILLYGPPGTGKTMCGPALAKECGLALIMCRGPEFLDRYIGASEAKVRQLFARAATAAPSILFLDELDALAPRRGSDHSGVTDRVVNQLLTFLDGVEDTADRGQVYVIATSSRPDKIDPALLRPGRLEKHVYFGFAQADNEVSDLLSCIAKRYNLDVDASEAISSGELVQTLRQDSIDLGRLSPADWKAGFNTGQLSAAHEALASGCTDEKVAISRHKLLQSIRSVRPSLLQADFDRLEEVYAAFRSPKFIQSSKGNKEMPLLTALR